MIEINSHLAGLQKNYLFSEIAARVARYKKKHHQKPINLGIGDTVLPLPAAAVRALHQAVEEMAYRHSFRGYGPEQGYPFLRTTIAEHDYQQRDITIHEDEIFISDGAKSDAANIQELFSSHCSVAIPNPVYPVYQDTNIIAGRGNALHYLAGTAENDFIPLPPPDPYDVIYLCYPNNPTGVMCKRKRLAQWVQYALDNNAILIYDAAYESFICDPELPHSIYEIPNADQVAIEIRSFSKNASFTGTRCAFTVVPKKCRGYNAQQQPIALHPLWLRRCATKFNGLSYPVQRAAAALYSPEGKQEIAERVSYYMQNAAIIREALKSRSIRHWGGVDAPYIWLEARGDSWELFDRLLYQAAVVTTPGAGFGNCGEGYLRISAFNLREDVERATEKLLQLL